MNVLAIGSNLIEGLVDSQELRSQVINVIRWADPAVILTNFPGEMSTDHNVPADEPPIDRKPSLFYWDTAA